MTVSINNILFTDVLSFGHNECEVAIVFTPNHGYSSIDELAKKLDDAGVQLGNWYFNGVNAYGVLDDPFDEKETSVLCTYHGDLQVDCRP